MDRVLFIASRFLWPVHNFVVLAAIGFTFQQRGLADYTYALALCAPVYFLTGYSFPVFLLIDSKDGPLSRSLAWIRIASGLATIPIVFGITLLVPSTQANVVLAVWLIKAGEILFDPLPTLISARPADSQRGVKVFMLDLGRVAIGQTLMWFSMLVLGWGIVRTLGLVGGCSIIVSMLFLITVPQWQEPRNIGADAVAAMRRIVRRATPMTVSGALLALLVSLPRLIAEPYLDEHERAIFGVAQALGTGAAVLFNSLWLYELHRIRADLAGFRLRGAMRKNTMLSAVFCAALAFGALALVVVQPQLFAVLRISAAPSPVLPVLFAALGLQHCISVHRDTLKFTGQQWQEAGIVLQTLVLAVATYYSAVYAVGMHWLGAVVTMCVVASAAQVLLSVVSLRRHSREAALSRRETAV